MKYNLIKFDQGTDKLFYDFPCVYHELLPSLKWKIISSESFGRIRLIFERAWVSCGLPGQNFKKLYTMSETVFFYS